MNGEKVTLYDDKLLFRDTGGVLLLKGDFLLMITDYDFNKTHSPYAKQFFNFLNEMHFDTHARVKSSTDNNLIKKLF